MALTETSLFSPRREAPLGRDEARPEGEIPDFRILSLLGEGGMGRVWLAEQVSLRRRVALKVVRPDLVNEKTLALFSREARAGGRLSHPGIVTVFGYGESNGAAWLALELVEGARPGDPHGHGTMAPPELELDLPIPRSVQDAPADMGRKLAPGSFQ